MSRKKKQKLISDFTSDEISTMSCDRCGNKTGYADWRVCSLGNENAHILCRRCDVELNETVVRWAFGAKRDAELASYREKILGAA